MKIIVITGPTAVGKTNISIKLAKQLNAEIINADSMQIYKELNIGVAKIQESEMDNIKHHMLNIKSIKDNYSVFDYQKDARIILENNIKNNKNTIIVGGTGLYIKALLYNYEFEENKNDSQFLELSNKEIYDKINNVIALDINNRRRLVRTLNKLNSNHSFVNKENELLYKNVIFIGINMDRDKLYENINKRVDIMFENNLLEEFENFKNINSRILKTAIGYKELYLDLSLEEKKELIKKNTRNYAKRQLTWFKNKMDLKWFDNYDNVLNYIKEFK